MTSVEFSKEQDVLGAGLDICQLAYRQQFTPINRFMARQAKRIATQSGAQAWVMKPELDDLRETIFRVMNTRVASYEDSPVTENPLRTAGVTKLLD
jgi:predicted xylose isomerase-like sugar epimerase